jgi:predicted tellurium resistance membrane protein TerC
MEWLFIPEAWLSLLALTALEIVLGIDNIIFISVLVSRLPAQQQERARVIGLSLAMLTRILLLLSITWIMSLQKTLFTLGPMDISGNELILLAGGLFLIAKSTHEIHNSFGEHGDSQVAYGRTGFGIVLIQIACLDIVFSLDSVITAVGLVKYVSVMIIAIIISMIIMIVAAKSVSQFIHRHPTIKMLALSFLILIGVTLVAEGLDFYIPKGYIYFAMAFSLLIELLNIKLRKKHQRPKSAE